MYFSTVLLSLGHETTPSKDFVFVKGTCVFAAACSSKAKGRLPVSLQSILGEMLPVDEVMSCSDTPGKLQRDLPFENIYRDIPAMVFRHQMQMVECLVPFWKR